MNNGPSDDGTAGIHRPTWGAVATHAPLKLEEFLPYRLNVVASLVSQALSRIYAERYGIGVPEWRVLVTLGQYGMMTGKAIGAHSHMHKTKVSRAVALLEKRKLVARRANRADLRESFLALTPAGRAMYEDLAPIALEFAQRLVRGDRSRRPRGLRARRRPPDRALGQACRRGREGRARRVISPHASSDRPAGSCHEALHLLPLVRRLSGAHRAQPQGHRLRADPDPSHQGRRPAALGRNFAPSIRSGGCRRSRSTTARS